MGIRAIDDDNNLFKARLRELKHDARVPESISAHAAHLLEWLEYQECEEVTK